MNWDHVNIWITIMRGAVATLLKLIFAVACWASRLGRCLLLFFLSGKKGCDHFQCVQGELQQLIAICLDTLLCHRFLTRTRMGAIRLRAEQLLAGVPKQLLEGRRARSGQFRELGTQTLAFVLRTRRLAHSRQFRNHYLLR